MWSCVCWNPEEKSQPWSNDVLVRFRKLQLFEETRYQSLPQVAYIFKKISAKMAKISQTCSWGTLIVNIQAL